MPIGKPAVASEEKCPTEFIRKGSWFEYTQASWIGLPDTGTTARLSTPGRPDNTDEQTVIGGAAFFEIVKPDWTQIGTLTLRDESGNIILTAEDRLQVTDVQEGWLGRSWETETTSVPGTPGELRCGMPSAGADRCRLPILRSAAALASTWTWMRSPPSCARQTNALCCFGQWGTPWR